MVDIFEFLIDTQDMPPFDCGQMVAAFNTQNMPPFDHSQMVATFKLLNDISNAAI